MVEPGLREHTGCVAGGTVTGLKSLDDDKKQQMTAIRHRLPPHAALAA